MQRIKIARENADRRLPRRAAQTAESAGHMSQEFGQLADLAEQARDTAGQVAQSAEQLHRKTPARRMSSSITLVSGRSVCTRR